MVRVSVGVDDGFYRLGSPLSQQGFQPLPPLVGVQGVDENEGGVALDGDGVAVAQADDAADAVSGLEYAVWVSCLSVVLQALWCSDSKFLLLIWCCQMVVTLF